jgi:hypothetical protein
MNETGASSMLEYQNPPARRRDSAWSVVGFALALLTPCFAGAMGWNLWHSRRAGSGGRISFGVTPVYYVVMAAVAALCVRGLMVGRRRFAIAGLVVAGVSFIAVMVMVFGSPW